MLEVEQCPSARTTSMVLSATAAQGFQVCSGAVKYEQSRKDSVSYERTTESKAGTASAESVDEKPSGISNSEGGKSSAGEAAAFPFSVPLPVGAGALGAGLGLFGSRQGNDNRLVSHWKRSFAVVRGINRDVRPDVERYENIKSRCGIVRRNPLIPLMLRLKWRAVLRKAQPRPICVGVSIEEIRSGACSVCRFRRYC